MVNILEVDISDFKKKFSNKDKLEALFELQKSLMSGYARKEVDLDTLDGQRELREIASYVSEELYEAIGTLKNRPWVKTQTLTDRTHYYEELTDALHFFIQLLIMSGIDADKLYEVFLKKVKVNEFRLRSGY